MLVKTTTENRAWLSLFILLFCIFLVVLGITNKESITLVYKPYLVISALSIIVAATMINSVFNFTKTHEEDFIAGFFLFLVLLFFILLLVLDGIFFENKNLEALTLLFGFVVVLLPAFVTRFSNSQLVSFMAGLSRFGFIVAFVPLTFTLQSIALFSFAFFSMFTYPLQMQLTGTVQENPSKFLAYLFDAVVLITYVLFLVVG